MTDTSVAAEQLSHVVTRMVEIASQHGRTTLGRRLSDAALTLTDNSVRVVIIGQFKQGKSALVNALADAAVCPVDDLVATSVPTVLRWGPEPRASLVTHVDGAEEPFRTNIDPRHLREHVTELARASGYLGNLHAEVKIPSHRLRDGLILVDTPGVGKAGARALTNLALLPQADAAIMVSDATQELTRPELTFLQQASGLCPQILCVVSKLDLQLHWRDIVAANTSHLENAGLEVPVIPTSSLLHDVGRSEGEAALIEDSRIETLAHMLSGDVRASTLARRRQSVTDEIHGVADHLLMVLDAERRALESNDSGAVVVQTLEEAQQAATALAQRSVRWQQTLTDGAGELIADVEFDLRDRLREVGREAEELIATCDPGKSWADIGEWLADSITIAASDNFVWAHQRSIHLADTVAQHFSVDSQAALPDLELSAPDNLLDAIGGLDYINAGHITVGQKVMIGMKGSYAGVLMFGLMTTLAGMALVNPVSVAAGLIMGGFAYRQDAKQRLEQSRAEARAAVRKLIDEAIFQISKESRDRMGRVRRVLRDHFVALAEELKESLDDSIRRAKLASTLPPSERSQRMAAAAEHAAEIRALLARADGVANQAVERV